MTHRLSQTEKRSLRTRKFLAFTISNSSPKDVSGILMLYIVLGLL